MKQITTFELLDSAIQKVGGKPIALEVLWDGDTEGWFLSVYLYTEKRYFFNKKQTRHSLGYISLGDDIRIFNADNPWTEISFIQELAEKTVAKYNLEFYFPSSDKPDDNCPTWLDRQKHKNKEQEVMAFTIKKEEIINYPPEKLNDFEVMMYEWVDNLHFTLNPKDCIENANAYISIVKQRFLEAGWEGDGEIELMWIPPFILDWMPKIMLEHQKKWRTEGIVIWHVKQIEDGLSWLLYPNGFNLFYDVNIME